MSELLCTAKNGKEVSYDPLNSHAATHFADTPNLKELVVEAIQNRNLDNTQLDFEVDMGRVIGTCDVVESNDSDELVYAIRKNRLGQGYAPFVRSRKAQRDSILLISLVYGETSYKAVKFFWQ